MAVCLIKHGARLETGSPLERRLFKLAVKTNHMELLRIVVDNGLQLRPRASYNVLGNLLPRCSVDAANFLIDRCPELLDEASELGLSAYVQVPLTVTIRHCSLEMIDMLLCRGASSHERDTTGIDPLDAALQDNDAALHCIFGDTVTPSLDNVRTAFSVPMRRETAERFLKAAVDENPDVPEYAGESAAQCGNVRMVKTMLDLGYKPRFLGPN